LRHQTGQNQQDGLSGQKTIIFDYQRLIAIYKGFWGIPKKLAE